MKNSIILLSFALVSSASFSSSMSAENQAAINEATAKNIVVASDASLADENNMAVLDASKAWEFCSHSEAPTMSDEYQAAVLEAVGFWN